MYDVELIPRPRPRGVPGATPRGTPPRPRLVIPRLPRPPPIVTPGKRGKLTPDKMTF
jgi:hypothetical protein